MTAIPVSPELKTLFDQQKDGGNIRTIKIVISESEVCETVKTVDKGVSMEKDFDQLSTLCDKSPSYFLFRKDDNNWMVIIFIPDASKVSEKLVYAATTSPLKNNLGYQFEEFSATSPIELSWKEYQERKLTNIDMRSEREKAIDNLNAMEAQARKEFEEMARGNYDTPTVDPTAQQDSPNKAAATTTITITAQQSAATQSNSTKPFVKTADSSNAAPNASTSTSTAIHTTPATRTFSNASNSAAGKPIGGYYGKPRQSGALCSPSSAVRSVHALTAAFECGTPTASSSSTSYYGGNGLSHSPANDPVTGISKPTNAKGIGGFHVVTLPIDDGAKNSISQLQSGAINWAEFKIENERIVAGPSCQLQGGIDSAKSHVSTTEPRFYLYSSGAGAAGYNYSAGASRSSAVFVYCCPEKSPQRLRMVYATAKQNITDAAQQAGMSISKKIEISDPADLTTANVNASAAPGRGYNSSYAQTAPVIRHQHTVNTPHPVYSMMNDSTGNMGGMKKHIVLPPRGAY